VTYLAYPATSGMRAMDYRITDPHLDPPGSAESPGPERLLRLPETYWCYRPLEAGPGVGPLPSAATGRVTFGSLNNFCKLNREVLRVWGEILDALPTSRLTVLVNGRSRAYRTLLEEGGIPGDRVELLERRPHEAYLRHYDRIDVSLDPFPCGGHTTTLDALWMGVPVVTLAGPTAMGRAAASALSNLGLRELITRSPGAYVRAAVALAGDPDRLRALRAELRPRLRASALHDATRLARHLEAAYRRAWVTWCAGRSRDQAGSAPGG
jgi:predicted O-linked N-acetylglucosamine transferase (SPINDLY family)